LTDRQTDRQTVTLACVAVVGTTRGTHTTHGSGVCRVDERHQW